MSLLKDPAFRARVKRETAELASLVQTLNSEKETQRGITLSRWLNDIRPHLGRWHLGLPEASGRRFRAERGPNSHITIAQHVPRTLSKEDQAFFLDISDRLVNNLAFELLEGPCLRCGTYFVRKRSSQKVYCSKRCGNAATALARTKDRQKAERRLKLDKLQTAIALLPENPQGDWKRWVAAATGIELRFLTRALNKGDLIAPLGISAPDGGSQ